MVGRRRRRAPRELSSSSRQSPPTDIAEINTKSPAIFLSWRALSRHQLFIVILARHSRPSTSRITLSCTIKRMPFTRAAGFDDSIGWTSAVTSKNMTMGPAVFSSHCWEMSAKREKKGNDIDHRAVLIERFFFQIFPVFFPRRKMFQTLEI